MPHPNSITAYDDCFALLDKTMETEKGIQVPKESKQAAQYLISRLNYARRLQRLINEAAWPVTDKRHYGTQYDEIVIRNPKEKDGRWWVRIERSREVDFAEIKEL
jgi:hypothetical protein